MFVRFLKLLPVKVKAVPTESDTEKDLATKTSKEGIIVAVAAAV
jgi:hypothetical protein